MNASVQGCPEPVALPIIFVPGIMGSRLRNRQTGALAWDPGTGLGTLWGGITTGPQAKRRQLVAAPGQPYDPDYLTVDMGQVGGTLTQERFDRGWGGLLADSYMGFMSWLQLTAESPAMEQVPRGCFALHYEAWAHPYNWTDDNRASGEKLAATVDAAVAWCNEHYAGRDIRVLKPVLVTHSMGGLVARAYTQLFGGAGKVHGVIHGALPTDGAPATYKRMLAGSDGISRFVLGANQAEVTATAGNCPGPLQLLPNTRHRSVDGSRDWLRCVGSDGSRRWSRPMANPYGEIYANQTDWWRLIYRDLLDPEGDPTGAAALQGYRTQITKAANYHAELGSSGFHANTRMFWSADPGQACWDHIEWRQTAQQDVPSAGRVVNNDGRGTIEWGDWVMPMGGVGSMVAMPVFHANTRYSIQEADAPGDTTVHSGAGLYAVGPMSVPTRRGFEHQRAFDLNEARTLVAEWLFDFVQEQL